MGESAQIVAVTAAIASAVGALIGVLSTKGVDGLIRLRKSKIEGTMTEKKYDDGVAAEAYALFKDAMISRVSALESALTSVTTKFEAVTVKLEECRVNHAKAEVETERVKGDMRVMQVQLDRLTQHDEATKKQIAKNLEEAERIKAKTEFLETKTTKIEKVVAEQIEPT